MKSQLNSLTLQVIMAGRRILESKNGLQLHQRGAGQPASAAQFKG